MTSFDDVLKEIYFQMGNVKDSKRLPYYLFVSKSNYATMKNELTKDAKRYPDGKVEYFENMEVVVISDVPASHIEVKGIIDRNARQD